MTTTNPQFRERRRTVQAMTDAQFREFCMQHFDAGTACMNELRDLLTENTALTQKAVDLSDATARDTAGLIAIEKFGKSAADTVKKGARGMNWTSKLLFRLLIIVSIWAAIWHGKWPDWKQILEALK